MIEGYNPQPEKEQQPRNEWRGYNSGQMSSEKTAQNYHVEYGVGEKPNVLEVQHLMEMDPENTILVAGDNLIYLGGNIEVSEEAAIKVAMPVYGGEPGLRVVRPTTVYRILEDGRTLVYAIDVEKARQYIEAQQNRAVA